MSDLPTLLPPNTQAVEYDLEQLSQRIEELPAPIRTLWDVDTCPEPLLPWLGWAFSVEVWESDWTATVKRAVIRNAISVHRNKGTKAAVLEALSALGLMSAMTEWFEYGGTPGTFFIDFQMPDMLGASYALDARFIDQIRAILEDVKPVRSHYQVRVSETSENTSFLSPATGEMMIDELAMAMEIP